ncbi:MAG: hypothetical protein GF418_17630 [Chitinivibrionales bacterium]|nr:hypothetical protein [Chitinivibrionales bacterium]MBD3397443.1 hypothetical protein [Chitinivibrionales bacterium]
MSDMTSSFFRRLSPALIISCAAMRMVQALPAWVPQNDTLRFSGYVKETPVLRFEYDGNDQATDNILQARLRSRFSLAPELSGAVEGRALLLTGDSFNKYSSVAKPYAKDANYVDMTGAAPGVLYGTIDRAWLRYQRERVSVTVGRQRVNWGTNFVWNPNDWFNAYSFLDFVYEEHAGVDGARVEFYPGPTSGIELAANAGKEMGDRTIAGRFRTNLLSYDIHLQAGTFGEDFAAGAGWAGRILDAGFRGEISYFHALLPDNDSIGPWDTTGVIVAALGADYTFPSSLYFRAEVLANGFGSESLDPATGTVSAVSAKNLSPARYSLYGEGGYVFSPLVQSRLAVIGNPADRSFVVSPAATWTPTSDAAVDFLIQLNIGDTTSEFGSRMSIAAMLFTFSF